MAGSSSVGRAEDVTRLVALTRPVSASIAACEITHVERTPIDVSRARTQHADYCTALRAAGCSVVSLPVADSLPDAVFIEDTALVLDDVAVLTRPGAASRRAELDAVRTTLPRYRPLLEIHAPGTLDGGDVLRVGRTIYVGRSLRTNDAAIQQLRDLLAPLGYAVTPVDVTGCLHLKTAVTSVAEDTLIVNSAWIDSRPLRRHRLLDVDPAEPFAANVLRIGDRVLIAAAFPRTAQRLEARGISVTPIDVSELARAEGGLTCCSILFEHAH